MRGLFVGPRLAVAVGAAACATSPSRPSGSVSNASVDRPSVQPVAACAMVEAAFQLDAFRTFAGASATTSDGRILVDVDMMPVFPSGAECPSRVFALYRNDEPTNKDALLQLRIQPLDEQTWSFVGAYIDPSGSPDDAASGGGGFDTVDYYTVFGFGRLARSEHGWRAWSERR